MKGHFHAAVWIDGHQARVAHFNADDAEIEVVHRHHSDKEHRREKQAGHASPDDAQFLEAVTRAVSIPVVASGGAGSPEHLRQALAVGADAALAASIFHYGEYTIPETKEYLHRHGIPVRLKRERTVTAAS